MDDAATQAPPAPPTAHADEAGEVRPGDRVLLLEPGTGRRWLLTIDGGGARKERGLGVLDPGRLVGQRYGSEADAGAKRVVVLRPRLPDLVATLRRKAQVILPKDASRIAFELGLGPGDRVFECGVGSGGATMVFAHAVGPTGRVVVQELREEFAEWAHDNLARAGLAGRTEIHVGDLGAGLAPGASAAGPFDAALLDLPEPWAALAHLWPALVPGAVVACYCPQVVQMERTVRTLLELGADEVRPLELIERAWEVKERGSRPAFGGLGHTGFLVFGRRIR